MINSKKISLKVNSIYAPILFAFYGSSATLMGYMTVILQTKNFSDFQIGLTASLASVASILFQPLLGRFSDKSVHIPLKHIVISLCGIMIAFAIGLMLLESPLLVVMLLAVILNVLFLSIMSLLDSLALQFENRGISVNHGLARGLGSLGFAIVGFLTGQVVTRFGTQTIIPMFCVLFLLAVILLLFFKHPDKIVPQYHNDTSKHRKRVTLRSLLHKNPGLIFYGLAIGFIATNRSILDTFQVRIVQELGGTAADYGIALLIMAISELPTMFMFKILTRKFGLKKMLGGGFIFFAVKDIALLFAPNVITVIVLQVLNLLTVGLYNSAAIYRTNEIVGENAVVTGQALVAGVATGLCVLLGVMAAGAILENINYKAMLIFAAVIVSIGFALMQISSVLLKKRSIAQSNY